MKKIVSMLLMGIMIFSLVGCGAAEGNEEVVKVNPAADKTVEEIATMITEDAGIEAATMLTPLDAETFSWFLFIDAIEGAEAVAADAMMSAVAHSVVVVRLPEGTDANEVAKQIEEKADPRKWICVEAEKTVVKVNGDLVLLVMSSSDVADAVASNFENLK